MFHDRGKFFVLALVVATVAFAAPAATEGAKPTWIVKVLEGPAGFDWYGSAGNDVSDSGYIGGGWMDEDGRMHPVYWYKGTAYDLQTEIGMPTGTGFGAVMSLNSAGLMGGFALSEDGSVQHGVLWDVVHGTLTDLHPGGDLLASEVDAVNARGDAAGLIVSPTATGWRMDAYAWPKNNRKGLILPGAKDYMYSWVAGINSSGDMVGVAVTQQYKWYAVMWMKTSDGYELIDLQQVFGDDYFAESQCWDISEDGTVVGIGYPSSGPLTMAFSWSPQDGLEILDDDSMGDSVAWKTVSKYIAGGIGFGTFTNYGHFARDDAVIWVNGTLEVVAEEVGKYEYVEASSVNKSGLVVGAAFAESEAIPIGWYAEKK